MPPRCPKGSRRNKKTGNCEQNSTKRNGSERKPATESKKQKRCAKGTRRNKKTGKCESLKSAKPEPNNVIFKFKPSLSINTTTQHMEKIVKWYKPFAIQFTEVEDVKLDSIKADGNKILITLSNVDTLNQNDITSLIELIVNPDEDGNHPLKIENNTNLVSGDDVEIKMNGEWIRL
jgi:hypothetical protein